MYNLFMPLLRKIFFYIFVLIYLILCPWVIVRALGFLPSFKTHRLVKTGIIYISTNPAGAHVFINDKPNKEKTPVIIRDLTEGKYTVNLYLNNYRPFHTTVPVAEAKATALENILMIPQQWKTKELSSIAFDEMIPVAENNYLVVDKNRTIADVYLLKTNKNLSDENDKTPNPQPLFPEEFIYRDAQVVHFFTINKSPFFIVRISDGEKQKFLWVDIKERTPLIEDISDLFVQMPEALYWEANDDRNIFALSHGSVNHINIKAKAIYPKILENIVGMAIAEGDILAMNNDLLLLKYNYEGQNKKLLKDHLIVPFDQNQRPKALEIQKLNDKIILGLTQDGELMEFASNIFLADDIKGFKWDPDTRQLLVWTKDKIGIVDFSTQSKNAPPAIRWVFIRAERIEQAFFANNGGNILFVDNNKTWLLEKECFTTPQAIEVVAIKTNSRGFFEEKTGEFYYLNPQGTLCSVRILHHQPSIPGPVAEQLKLKQVEY